MKRVLLGRRRNYIIKSMGKPDEYGIVPVEASLLDDDGTELADTGIRVITAEEIEATDKLLGVDGDSLPDAETLAKIHEKMKSYNDNVVIRDSK